MLLLPVLRRRMRFLFKDGDVTLQQDDSCWPLVVSEVEWPLGGHFGIIG